MHSTKKPQNKRKINNPKPFKPKPKQNEAIKNEKYQNPTLGDIFTDELTDIRASLVRNNV